MDKPKRIYTIDVAYTCTVEATEEDGAIRSASYYIPSSGDTIRAVSHLGMRVTGWRDAPVEVPPPNEAEVLPPPEPFL
jgi:hypothetical protein